MTAARDFSTLAAGFHDSAREAQALFRRVLQAVARPGRVADLSAAPAPPEGLDRAAAALALTLCDAETPVWLGARLAEGPIRDWLAFHCSAPQAATPADAAFALVDAGACPPLDAFAQGEARHPDRSATVILICEALEGGARRRVVGPGIDGEIVIAPKGLPPEFWSDWTANTARFPLGVDALLVAGASLLALPRTARVELIEG